MPCEFRYRTLKRRKITCQSSVCELQLFVDCTSKELDPLSKHCNQINYIHYQIDHQLQLESSNHRLTSQPPTFLDPMRWSPPLAPVQRAARRAPRPAPWPAPQLPRRWVSQLEPCCWVLPGAKQALKHGRVNSGNKKINDND